MKLGPGGDSRYVYLHYVLLFLDFTALYFPSHEALDLHFPLLLFCFISAKEVRELPPNKTTKPEFRTREANTRKGMYTNSFLASLLDNGQTTNTFEPLL